jgi:hypothetical protein
MIAAQQHQLLQPCPEFYGKPGQCWGTPTASSWPPGWTIAAGAMDGKLLVFGFEIARETNAITVWGIIETKYAVPEGESNWAD